MATLTRRAGLSNSKRGGTKAQKQFQHLADERRDMTYSDCLAELPENLRNEEVFRHVWIWFNEKELPIAIPIRPSDRPIADWHGDIDDVEALIRDYLEKQGLQFPDLPEGRDVSIETIADIVKETIELEKLARAEVADKEKKGSG